MKEAVMKVIDTLTQEDFHWAFQKLLERYNKSIAAGGDHFEGDSSFTCVLSISSAHTKNLETYLMILVFGSEKTLSISFNLSLSLSLSVCLYLSLSSSLSCQVYLIAYQRTTIKIAVN